MTIRKNVASQKLVFTLVSATTGGVLTGATVTAKLSIDGGASSTAGGSVAELANGQYCWSPSQADTNGNALGVQFTATGAIPVAFTIFTTAADPTDSVRLGLMALPNAAAGANGGVPLSVDTNGRVDVLKVNGTSQTARDLGATLGVAGAGLTALGDTRIANLDATVSSRVPTSSLPANFSALVIDTTGRVNAFLIGILTSVFTEGATGQIAAAFKKFFNVASSSLTTGGVDQTGDSFARLGVPAGASIAADIAALATTLSGLASATATAVWAAGSRTLTSFGTLVADVATAVWGAVTRTLTAGTNIVLAKGTGLTGLNDLAATDVRAAVGLASANLDTQLGGIADQTNNLPNVPMVNTAGKLWVLDGNGNQVAPEAGGNVAAIKAKTDTLPSDPASQSAVIAAVPTANANADALLDRANAVDAGLTPRSALKLAAAALAGKASGAGTSQITFRDTADTKNRIVADVDADGNRTSVMTDLS